MLMLQKGVCWGFLDDGAMQGLTLPILMLVSRKDVHCVSLGATARQEITLRHSWCSCEEGIQITILLMLISGMNLQHVPLHAGATNEVTLRVCYF